MDMIKRRIEKLEQHIVAKKTTPEPMYLTFKDFPPDVWKEALKILIEAGVNPVTG